METIHILVLSSYNLPRQKKLTQGKRGTNMNKRTNGKTEWYAHLLQKLHIISEQEKQQIIKTLHKNKKDKYFS